MSVWAEQSGSRFRGRVELHGHKSDAGTWDTREQAIEAARAREQELLTEQLVPPAVLTEGVAIEGVTVAEAVDEEAVWRRACEEWARTASLEKRRHTQAVSLPGPVACLVAFADEHLGDSGVDYPRYESEASQVRDTPGMWAVHAGDLVSNFIKAKMAHIRLQSRLSIPDEAVLAKRCLRILAPKLLAAVGGNHPAWTEQLSGLDYFADVLGSVVPDALYDPDECVFDLSVNCHTWRVKMRHKWRGSSIYSASHGIERSCRMDEPFDIGIGAHTHESGLVREFNCDGRTRLAVVVGSYKRADRYVRQLGLSRANNSTAMAVLFDGRDGTAVGFGHLDEAARVLRACN